MMTRRYRLALLTLLAAQLMQPQVAAAGNLNWVVLPATPVADKVTNTDADQVAAPQAEVPQPEQRAKQKETAALSEPLIPPAVEVEPLVLPTEDQTSTRNELTETVAEPITVDSGKPLDEFESAGAVLNDAASTPLISTGEPQPLEQSEPETSAEEVIPAEEEAYIRSLLEAEEQAQTLREDADATLRDVSPIQAEDVPEAVATAITAADESAETLDSSPVDLRVADDLENAMATQLADSTADAEKSVADSIDDEEPPIEEAPAQNTLADADDVTTETSAASPIVESVAESVSSQSDIKIPEFTVAGWMLDEPNHDDLRIPQATEVADITQLPASHASSQVSDSFEAAVDMQVIAKDVVNPKDVSEHSQLAFAPSVPTDATPTDATVEVITPQAVEPGTDEEDVSPTSNELAQIEAELNETLVLGPVAVGDDVEPVSGHQNAEDAREDLSELVLAKDVAASALGGFDGDSTAEEDLPAPIPLVDILELALANNPEVGMALAREEQARWAVREAGAYRSPTLDLVIEAGPEYNRPATKTSDIEDITPGRNMNVRLTKLLYDGGTSVSEEQRRHQLRRSTEIETRRVIEEIVVKAIKSYMEILQNQQAARVADDFVAEMKRMVDQINVMKDSGAASKIELDFAKSRLSSAIAQTGTTAAQLNDAVASLEFLTGDLPPFTAVTPMKAGEIHVAPLQSYSDRARNNNSEVLLNASNKTALGMKLRGQMGQYKPILTFNMKSEALADEGGNLDPRNTTEAKLKIEYFLIDGGVRKARIQKTKAQLVELDWDHERVVKDVDRRVKQSYNQITTNRLTLSATEDEIAANEELRRLNRKNLEIGDISILELIEVEERLYNSRANRDRIAAEMLRNYYELLIGTGDLPQVLSEDYVASRIEPLEQ